MKSYLKYSLNYTATMLVSLMLVLIREGQL